MTADHGAHRNDIYLGNNKYQSCCGFENNSTTVDPPYWIDHLKQLGRLKTTYQDTSVKVWLADSSAQNEAVIAAGMTDIPGMTEVFSLRSRGADWHYQRVWSRLEHQSEDFRRWAKAHHEELVNTMAADGAPHLVGLLADNYGFGRIGDHGGAQEAVQRIPLMIRVPGEKGTTRPNALRLADISREIALLMNLK